MLEYSSAVWMCTARALTGLTMGAYIVSVSLYIAEISTKEMRGLLGSMLQLFITLGVLAVYLLGTVLKWKWLAVIAIVITVCNILTLVVSHIHDTT